MKKTKRRIVQASLFVVTTFLTTLSGAELMYGRSLIFGDQRLTWDEVLSGWQYSIPFLLILTVHEFGHYFTARFHRIKVTLPYYIPLWLGFLGTISFGTMGAFIRIQEAIKSRKHYFDVGVSGPLAGFVIALGVIWYGFTHLPPAEYIYEIHPEYEQYGLNYPDHVYDGPEGLSFRLGGNLLFDFFEQFVLEDPTLMPHPNELYHYPYLMAGYLALFFTALNLLPIGQLDGGHVMFGLFGPRISRRLNEGTFLLFLTYAGMGWVHPDQLNEMSALMSVFYLLLVLYFTYVCMMSMFNKRRDRLMAACIVITVEYILTFFVGWEGYGGWMLFAFILGRFIGVYHPPVVDNRPLSPGRVVLGWIAIVVFILSFIPRPFVIN